MSTSPDSPPASQPIAGIPSGTPIEIVGQSTDEKKEVARQQDPYISFEHVSKSFGDVHVLDDVSFSVQAGETLCILGRSGVGKSVSLQQIMGFLKPDAGRIMVAGQDITSFTEEQMETVRKKVTMVFQNGALFDSLSVGKTWPFPCENAASCWRIRYSRW